MRRFARLVETLELTSSPSGQISLLAGYFRAVADDEKTIALRFLYGTGPRSRLNANLLKQWAMELSGIPEWLLAEAGKVAGDTAETLALVLPGKRYNRHKSLVYWATALDRLPSMDDRSRKAWVCQAWTNLGRGERFIFNKLLCGRFRPPVSPGVLVAALSQVTGIDRTVLAWRLHRDKADPGGISYLALAAAETAADIRARPYPFSNITAEIKQEPQLDEAGNGGGLERDAEGPEDRADKTPLGRHWLEDRLGPAADWSAQRKWAGIPAQIVCREGQLYIWTRLSDGPLNEGAAGDAAGGDVSRNDHPRFTELVTACFPELHNLSGRLPGGTVLEGELLGLLGGRSLPAFGLEKRIGRKTLPKSLLAQLPAIFMAYDCLEYEGQDIRALTWAKRRQFLESFRSFEDRSLRLAPQLPFQTWQQLAGEHERIRESGAEGLLLNRQDEPGTGWLWKARPYTFRGVLLYARGQVSGVYTHFSLGAWEQGKLLSFTTVECALSKEETEALATYIQENTTEKFGPVRTVKPGIVFEIAFDDVLYSARHRSRLRLRGVRMLRWLKESAPEEAGMLKSLRLLCDKH